MARRMSNMSAGSAGSAGSERSDAPTPEWEVMQMKTFTNWCNIFLGKRDMQIESLETGFEDGVKLINLVEVISEEKLGRYQKSPKMKIQKVSNLNLALGFINNFIREVGIGVQYQAEDVLNQERKLILGMIWVLIHKFSIASQGLEGTDGLKLWCQKNTRGYRGVNVVDFSMSWQNGLAFCALINKFRPDLLNYAGLDANDAAGNLTKAFDVAVGLGIPKLLDVNDMLRSRPDDKSVMTYVSFYWKTFSAMGRGAVGRERLATVLGRFRANQQAAKEYAERAAALNEWIDSKTNEFERRDYGATLEDVQHCLVAFNQHQNNDKPQKTAEKRAVESKLRNLRTKQRQEKSPVYEPPEDLTPEATERLWQALLSAERAYEEGAKAALVDQRDRSKGMARLQGRAHTLTAWIEEKTAILADEDLGNNRGETESKIKKHEAYLQEFAWYNGRAAEVQDGGPAYPEMAAQVEELTEQLAALEVASVQRKTDLENRLAYFIALENLCVESSSKAEGINSALDDVDEIIQEPIAAFNAADVATLQATVKEAEQALAAQLPAIEDLKAVNAQIGDAPNPYTRFTVDQLEDRYAELEEKIAQRTRDLADEAEKQTRFDAMRREFAEAISGFVQYANQCLVYLDELEKEGSLQSQLESVRNYEREVCQDYFEDALANLSQKDEALVAEHIADNEYSAYTLQDAVVVYEQLKKAFAERQQILNEKILAEQGMEIKPEQIQEFKEAFDYFDKNKNGQLSVEEFRMCQESLGHQLEDDQLKEIFKSLDVDRDGSIGFDEFLNYMVEITKVTDSYDDIVAAMRTQAGDKDFITEAELQGIGLSGQELEDIKSLMPKIDGGYDYNALLSLVFDTGGAGGP